MIFSYNSCLNKLKNEIYSRNKYVKHPNENLQCLVDKQCMTSNVVYKAEVKRKFGTKSYIGMSARPFITRWKEHRGNFRHKHQKGTKLPNHVHQQIDQGEIIELKDIK